MKELSKKLRELAGNPETESMSKEEVINQIRTLCGDDNSDHFYLARFHFETTRMDVFDEILAMSMIEAILPDLLKIDDMDSPLADIASMTLMTMSVSHDPFVDKLKVGLGDSFPLWEEKMLTRLKLSMRNLFYHFKSVGESEPEARARIKSHYLAEYTKSRYLPFVRKSLEFI
ncbi:hypothetical protein [Vibrio parahaemolyticus]